MGYLEKIKYILRGSRYYRKYFQTTVNSLRYYFRDLHYYWQLYSFKKDREVSGNTLYFIIDPNLNIQDWSIVLKQLLDCFMWLK